MNPMNGSEIARGAESEQLRAELEQERADDRADWIEERAKEIAKRMVWKEDMPLAQQARREALEDTSFDASALYMLDSLVWKFDDPIVQGAAIRFREQVIDVAAESALIMDEARKMATKELEDAE
jgi:hypothetical protein